MVMVRSLQVRVLVMARAIWKGAISFGLVHIPISLISATSSQGIDLDWLDKRSMDPVGYKRVNKTSGKEVAKENIVKGYQYEKGQYVILEEGEIKAAHPRSTQAIDIFSFIDSSEIPITHIETPYYLAPEKRGEKVYALLREALKATNKVAVANVVLHVRQHLAVLMPLDSALVLILLRWPTEVRKLDILELGDAVTHPKLDKNEKEMAKRLVEDMSGRWSPENYNDSFQEKIMALVEKKVKEGKIEAVENIEESEFRKSADVIDLTELLKRSLKGSEVRTTRKPKTTEDKSANIHELKTKSRASQSKARKTNKTPASTSKKAPEKKAVKTTRKRKGA